MSKTLKQNPLELAYKSVEENHAGESTTTRRQLVGATALGLGGLAAMSMPDLARAGGNPNNTPENILNIAATAEVLATIVNTVGLEKVGEDLDRVTRRNVRAAAFEEKLHYEALTGALGAVPVTKKIWVPSKIFRSPRNLLEALEVGDQIFINAYLIGTTVFAEAGNPVAARYAAEIMGVEAVHRALARQSLGKLGNDRAYMKYTQVEQAAGAPNRGTPGFDDITVAVAQLQDAGFGFGAQGSAPGRFYQYDQVSQRTKGMKQVNTRTVA